jgi:hypothetical protein
VRRAIERRITMKRHSLLTLCALTLLSVALSSPTLAEPARQKKPTTTTTIMMNRSGFVSELGPETIVIRTATSVLPFTYQSTETTTFVDEAGNAVAEEMVKSGVPVTVYYSKSGEKMVAAKVIVKETTAQPQG